MAGKGGLVKILQRMLATFFPTAWTVRTSVVHAHSAHEEILTVFAPSAQEAAAAVFKYQNILWRDLVAVDVISVVELKRPDQEGEPC